MNTPFEPTAVKYQFFVNFIRTLSPYLFCRFVGGSFCSRLPATLGAGLLIAVVSSAVFAQEAPQNNQPQIIPPSPTAFSFGQFGHTGANESQGLANISIPLFSLTEGDISLDIQLSYNSGGRKVDEIAGIAGLGWSLSAGGTITRTVRGTPDEKAEGYLSSGHILDNLPSDEGDLLMYLEDVHTRSTDAEPDHYHYSGAGSSGAFVYDYQGNIFTLPYEDIRIEGHPDSVFVVTTNTGITYCFEEIEKTILHPTSCSFNVTGVNSFHSTWYLTRIRSPLCHEIELTYDSASYNYEWSPSESMGSGGVDRNSCETTVGSNARFVSRITSPKYIVEFEYDFTRHDLENAPKLTGLKVTSAITEEVIRWYRFHYFETQNSAGSAYYDVHYGNLEANDPHSYRLFLKDIYTMSNHGTDSIRYYAMEYNATPLPSRFSPGKDVWGYYNGKNNNTSYVPSVKMVRSDPFMDTNILTLGTADRNVDTTLIYTKAGILEKVYYPTGGYSELLYEANTFNPDKDYSVVIDELLHDKLYFGNQQISARKSATGITGGGSCHATTSIIINTAQYVTVQAYVGFLTGCSPTQVGIRNASDVVVYSLSAVTQGAYNKSQVHLPAGAYTLFAATCEDTESIRSFPEEENPSLEFNLASIVIEWSHAYDFNGSAVTGGLRIAAMKDCTSEDCITTAFEYHTSSEYSSGELVYSPVSIQYKMGANVYLNNTSQGPVYIQNNAPDSVLQTRNYDSLFNWVSQLPDFTLTHFFSYGYSVSSSGGIFAWQAPHVTYTQVNKYIINDEQSDSTGMVVSKYLGLTDYFESLSSIYNQDSSLNDMLYDYFGWEPLENYYYRNNSGVRHLNRPYSAYLAPQLLFPSTSGYLGKLSEQRIYGQDQTLISSIEKEYSVYTNFDHVFVPNNTRGPAIECRVRGAVPDKLPNESFLMGRYTILIPRIDEVESTSIQYANGIASETKTNSVYDNLYFLLSRTETLNSVGDTLTTENYYAKDFSPALPIIGMMLEKNMHGLALQQVRKINSEVTGGSLTVYREDHGHVVDSAVLSLDVGDPISASQPVNGDGKITALIPFEEYAEALTYIVYDPCGNLLEFRDRSGIHYAVIRAYNNEYPVALISNITFSQLETIMGEDLAIVNASASESVIREKLENMRTELASTQPGRFVLYNPGIGVTAETDPNGKDVFYEYDAFNRLETIRDHGENILKTFRYNYKKP